MILIAAVTLLLSAPPLTDHEIPGGIPTLEDRPSLGAPGLFRPLFNERDLSGWKGLVANPEKRAAMSEDELVSALGDAWKAIEAHWWVENGEIVNDGKGPHLCTHRDYGDFEMWMDWKISPGADSGIYLRGSPQVQIWDPVHGIDQAKVGSGGLYNNQKNPSRPLAKVDRPANSWNTTWVRMVGERVWVALNGQLVVDDTPLENYWNRKRPIYPRGQIELQTHGGEIRFRRLFIREIPYGEAKHLLAREEEGFVSLFNGKNLDGWMGSVNGYVAEKGKLVCLKDKGGNLLTEKEYGDFILRFEFRVREGGNNGLAIRTPSQGNPAYAGMELQILDNPAEIYRELKDWQYHGSIYGVVAAHRGYQRPTGSWNYQEVVCDGDHIQVRLNGTTIVDANLSEIETPIDGQAHPGIEREKGHLGFMGHGHRVEFRNLRIKELR